MRKTMRMGRAARRRYSVAAAAVVLAFGAIVLARAHGAAADRPQSTVAPQPSANGTRLNVQTDEMTGFIALTQGAVLANGAREVFGEVRLEANAVDGETRRRPVALAVVLDTSGSMAGEKIRAAQDAVRQLLGRMQPQDRVSVVAYDHQARVLVPATTVATARETMSRWIEEIYASGGTNIPGGLQLGAASLDGTPAGFSRRLVLVSDGLDGSGLPLTQVSSSVTARAQSAVTTSALGVGVDYDERWLTTVADAGRGNYAFLARGEQLAGFLSRELDQAATTVADAARLELALPAGWRIASAHGATVDGSVVPLGSLYAGERRRVTLRMEVAAGAVGDRLEAPVTLRYQAAANRLNRNLGLGRLSLSVVSDEAQVVASEDVTLHAEAVAAYVDAQQAQAIDAWRDGRTAEATRLSDDNLGRLGALRQRAPEAAAAIDTRIQATSRDRDNFVGLRAQSAEGRAYGLESNAFRRSRAEAY